MEQENPDVRRWRLILASYTRHYGKNDPKTITAARELAKARLTVAQEQLARRQAELDALNGAAA